MSLARKVMKVIEESRSQTDVKACLNWVTRKALTGLISRQEEKILLRAIAKKYKLEVINGGKNDR